MKRKLCLFAILSLCALVLADSSPRTFFPSLYSDAIYPIDNEIGQTVPFDYSENHILLSNALKEPFSFEWCEKYINENSRRSLTTLYSALLANLLPSDSVLFSKSYTNADNSVSITAKFSPSNTIITFVISGKTIIGITSAEKYSF